MPPPLPGGACPGGGCWGPNEPPPPVIGGASGDGPKVIIGPPGAPDPPGLAPVSGLAWSGRWGGGCARGGEGGAPGAGELQGSETVPAQAGHGSGRVGAARAGGAPIKPGGGA